MELDRHRDRRDNAVQRANVAEELANRVITPDDSQLVPVSVELFAGQNRHRLHAGEIKSEAPSSNTAAAPMPSSICSRFVMFAPIAISAPPTLRVEQS